MRNQETRMLVNPKETEPDSTIRACWDENEQAKWQK